MFISISQNQNCLHSSAIFVPYQELFTLLLYMSEEIYQLFYTNITWNIMVIILLIQLTKVILMKVSQIMRTPWQVFRHSVKLYSSNGRIVQGSFELIEFTEIHEIDRKTFVERRSQKILSIKTSEKKYEYDLNVIPSTV